VSKVERHSKRLKLAAKNPGPWREMTITGEIRAEAAHLKYLTKRYFNGALQVDLFNCSSAVGGVVHAIVLRHGLLAVPSDQDMLTVKNTLFGIGVSAVEIFPAGITEMPKGIRHLWLLPSTWSLPFAFDGPTTWGGEL